MLLCIPGKDSLFCGKGWRTFFSLFEANTNQFGRDSPCTPFVMVLASQGRTVRKIKDTDLQPLPLCSPQETNVGFKSEGSEAFKEKGKREFGGSNKAHLL